MFYVHPYRKREVKPPDFAVGIISLWLDENLRNSEIAIMYWTKSRMLLGKSKEISHGGARGWLPARKVRIGAAALLWVF